MIEVQMTSPDGITLATAGKCVRDDVHIVPAFGTSDDTLRRLIERTITTIDFPEGLTAIGPYSLNNCRELILTELPNGLISIGVQSFSSCYKLSINTLPDTLVEIGNNAFNWCSGINGTFIFPASLKKVGNNVFSGTYISEFIFDGTPESISANSLANISTLVSIKVPWSEGAVANAPWGATNATITYNYTGDNT